jgi:MFS family permease
MEQRAEEAVASRAVHLVGWRNHAVLGVALVSMAAGFGQFGAVAALGDVARTFGHLAPGNTVADQAGLSATVIGVGLGILRLASLASLPLTGLADRFGRRPTMLTTCALGLVLTIVAAASPGYWWFVAIFALGRPLLSAANGIAQVSAAELTSTASRARAMALIAAGYGVGAGLIAIIHSSAEGALGFRGVFALSTVPLAFLPLISRWVVEPSRFAAILPSEYQPPVLGPVEPAYRGRLVVVALLAFAVSVITGPSNSLVFLYAENVRHVSGPIVTGMVVAAGFFGLAGLLAGRWLADRVGRRPAVALAMVGMAGCGILLYSGSRWAMVAGYVLGVLAGSVFAPAGGSLANELFPTSVRASVAGWYIAAGVLGAVAGLVSFGAVADAGGGGFGLAAVATFVPMVPLIALLLLLPETRGREPEELWPEAAAPAPSAAVGS